LTAVKRGTRRRKQIFFCENCLKYFSRPFKRTNSNLKQILKDHLDGLSFRKLVSRYDLNRNKICGIVNHQTDNLKNNLELTRLFKYQLNYSGNLVLDGKCIPVKEGCGDDAVIPGKIPLSRKRKRIGKALVIIWGSDYATHDLPHFELDKSENGDAFDNFFRSLKSIGYPLKSLTIDDKKEMSRAAKRHFANCVIQLCNRHYMIKITNLLGIDSIKIRINSKQKKIDKFFQDKESTFIPRTRKYAITQMIKLTNEVADEVADLEYKYELLIDFQNIIYSIIYADTYKIAQYRIRSLEKYFWPKRFAMKEYYSRKHIQLIKKLIRDFKEHEEYLLNYLKYPHLNIPNTTNLIEGYNSQLENRITNIKGFETFETAKNYINAWVIKRRFAKFTNCKNKFKKLNGKTPLECAGVDISYIRDWIRWCQK